MSDVSDNKAKIEANKSIYKRQKNFEAIKKWSD